MEDQLSILDQCPPLVLCGPSGVGKSVLIGKLMKDYPDSFGFSVSHTTRQPREGEINHIHYNFVTKEEITKDIDAGLFIEHANVHGNIYGTSINSVVDVVKKGKICILDIDIQGVESVMRLGVKAVYIMILPPSHEELERRLRSRATDSEEAITLRLKNSFKEIDESEKVNFTHRLVNDNLDIAYGQLKSYVAPLIEKLEVYRKTL
ncbi:hypothetical protein WA158_001648 [Blastocystis sp. Blastoise]